MEETASLTDGADNLDEYLGCRIATLRDRRGWNQKELAGRASLSRSFLCRLEKGKVTLKVRDLLRLSRTLGISLDEIVFGEGEPKDACQRAK
jgi:transcriptional regulator with XRE-family HTH domain